MSRRARAALDDDAANACVCPRLTFRRSCSACEERAPPGKNVCSDEALAPLVRSCDQLCELNVLELSQVGCPKRRGGGWGVRSKSCVVIIVRAGSCPSFFSEDSASAMPSCLAAAAG